MTRNGSLPWVAVLLLAAVGFSCRSLKPETSAPRNPAVKDIPARPDIDMYAESLLDQGRKIFRDDTFGDEDFWGGQLRLHEAIADKERGGTGAGVTPHQALQLGLKVDSDRVPK